MGAHFPLTFPIRFSGEVTTIVHGIEIQKSNTWLYIIGKGKVLNVV